MILWFFDDFLTVAFAGMFLYNCRALGPVIRFEQIQLGDSDLKNRPLRIIKRETFRGLVSS
jgi:hypothetical protein